MRQSELGETLSDLMAVSYDMRVTVQARDPDDTGENEWVTLRENMPMTVQAQTAAQRQETARVYTQPVTHIGFCDDDDENLPVGARLRVTARQVRRAQRGRGRWEKVAAEAAGVYLVLGKRAISGVPSPYDQVQLDLYQLTPTR